MVKERSDIRLNKTKVIRLLLIGIILVITIFLIFSNIRSNFTGRSDDNQSIQIVELENNLKLKTGEYLVVSNALYQKSIEVAKDLNRSVSLYQQNRMNKTELTNVIANSNKRLTYYYLVALQTDSPSIIEDLETDINYNFYLMRRGSEELLKFLHDESDLRLNVGTDLLQQAILREEGVSTSLATAIAKYDIDPTSIVVDQEIWNREYEFVAQTPDLVIFRDLNSSEVESYEYYLRLVNESFMLVSWELQNIYLSKFQYENEEITIPQLKSDLEKAGFVINRLHDELQLASAPEGLGRLESDTKNTITMYRDALLEIQKFRMSENLKHFDNALIIIEQADEHAGRIGEFIYSVRAQYRMD